MSSASKKFTDLAEKTVESLERIDCSVEEFIDGCSTVIEQIESSRDAAVECHKATS